MRESTRCRRVHSTALKLTDRAEQPVRNELGITELTTSVIYAC